MPVDDCLHREVGQRRGDQPLRPQMGDQPTPAEAFLRSGLVREASEQTFSLSLRRDRRLDEFRIVVNERRGIADERFEVLRISDEQGSELLGPFEAEAPHFGPDDRVIPLSDELFVGHRSLDIVAADHHEFSTRCRARASSPRTHRRTRAG